jgi:hypothetical protein
VLNAVLDTLIPADPDMEMPSASQAGVGHQLRLGPQAATVNAYLAVVQQTWQAQAEASGAEALGGFDQWPPTQRLELLNATRKGNMRLFAAFITAAFQAYFTSPAVLSRIGSGAVPPFPQGNTLPADDWTLLEPVYERGRLYRDVE